MTTTTGSDRPETGEPSRFRSVARPAAKPPLLAGSLATLCGVAMVVLGLWSWWGPESFARWIDYPPYNEHLLHDLGAFQLGIGVGVLAAVVWSDALGAALVGFLAGSTVHVVNHATDQHLGGHAVDTWALAVLDVVALAALILHVRHGRAPREQEHR